MKKEVIVLNEKRNVTLTAYIQDAYWASTYISKRPAMVVLPGGGYQYCSDREADTVAMAYLKAGYQVFILRYSVQEDSVWPNPLDDYEQAVGLIRSRSDEWNVYADKIAVIGFSAGGHLAACAATMAKEKPNAALLGYAVTKKETIKGCQATAPDVVSAVDKETCPCFIFATRDDAVVPVVNSIEMMQALAVNGISFESHIYAYGPHGFSTCDSSVQYKDTLICSRVPQWVPDSIAWLKDVLGDFGDHEMTEPVCKKHINGDYEDCLSIGCTFGYLWNCEDAKAVMEPLSRWMEEHKEEVAKNISQAVYHKTVTQGVIGLFLSISAKPLEEVLGYTGLSDDDVKRIDDTLRKIPN